MDLSSLDVEECVAAWPSLEEEQSRTREIFKDFVDPELGAREMGKKYGDKVIGNSDDLAMYLLEVGHVATVGGTSFGAPECIRFSYATSEDKIREAFRRIAEALAKLQ